MKNRILTLATIAILGLGSASYAAPKTAVATEKTEVSTVLQDINKISKIEVHGNVELYISNGTTDQVKVYNRYYAESALVQSKNGVLRISSYSDQKLVVWVTAYDLRSVAVYDNAELKSFGKLSAMDLDVTLNNNAYANLDLDGFSANITVNDCAKADLAGDVTECSLKYNHAATVNSTEFVSANIVRTVSNAGGYKNADRELVDL
ncbi:MAG: DUF2807 domain-containing protein [Mucilaginibacter sp.]